MAVCCLLQREDRQDLGEAHALLAPALAAIDAGAHKLGADPATDFLMRFSAAWVYTSMATLAVSMLEKEKRYTDACDLIRKLLGRSMLLGDSSLLPGGRRSQVTAGQLLNGPL